MRDKLYQATAKLPSLRCDLGGERCVPLNTMAVVETMRTPSSPALAPPTISSIEKPTAPGTSSPHWEKQVLQSSIGSVPRWPTESLGRSCDG